MKSFFSKIGSWIRTNGKYIFIPCAIQLLVWCMISAGYCGLAAGKFTEDPGSVILGMLLVMIFGFSGYYFTVVRELKEEQTNWDLVILCSHMLANTIFCALAVILFGDRNALGVFDLGDVKGKMLFIILALLDLAIVSISAFFVEMVMRKRRKVTPICVIATMLVLIPVSFLAAAVFLAFLALDVCYKKRKESLLGFSLIFAIVNFVILYFLSR